MINELAVKCYPGLFIDSCSESIIIILYGLQNQFIWVKFEGIQHGVEDCLTGPPKILLSLLHAFINAEGAL